MKKGMLILVCLIWSVAIFSQEKYYVYCHLYTDLSFTYGESGVKNDVKIFTGEETSFDKGFEHMKNKKGKYLSFKSMTDGLNYLGQYGWEPVQIYSAAGDKNANTFCLLRKEVTKEILEKVISKKTD